jgi:hypothetical protein
MDRPMMATNNWSDEAITIVLVVYNFALAIIGVDYAISINPKRRCAQSTPFSSFGEFGGALE